MKLYISKIHFSEYSQYRIYYENMSMNENNEKIGIH